MQPYERQISSSVIMLLRNCPADAVATRKELLVATRHILATDFRKGFFTEVRGDLIAVLEDTHVKRIMTMCGR